MWPVTARAPSPCRAGVPRRPRAIHGLAACAIGSMLAACASAPPVPPEPIRVPVYVRAPLPAALLQPCAVHEPDGQCWRDTARALCNGQLAELLVEYRAALAACAAQIDAIREMRP